MIRSLSTCLFVILALAAIVQIPVQADPPASIQDPQVRAGWQQLSVGNVAAAVDILTRAASAHPEESDAHRYLGQALMSAGLAQAALSHLQHVVQANPGDSVSLTALGDAQFYSGMNDEALSTYSQALQKDPHSCNAKLGLANACEAAHKRAQAVQLYQEVLQNCPDAEVRAAVQCRLEALNRKMPEKLKQDLAG